jgi:uncharacterized protein YtpQ (UPF0354 family)
LNTKSGYKSRAARVYERAIDSSIIADINELIAKHGYSANGVAHVLGYYSASGSTQVKRILTGFQKRMRIHSIDKLRATVIAERARQAHEVDMR